MGKPKVIKTTGTSPLNRNVKTDWKTKDSSETAHDSESSFKIAESSHLHPVNANGSTSRPVNANGSTSHPVNGNGSTSPLVNANGSTSPPVNANGSTSPLVNANGPTSRPVNADDSTSCQVNPNSSSFRLANGSTSCPINSNAPTSYPVNSNILTSCQVKARGIKPSPVTFKSLPLTSEAKKLIRFYNNHPALLNNVQRNNSTSNPSLATSPLLSNATNVFIDENPSEENVPFCDSIPIEKAIVPTINAAVQCDPEIDFKKLNVQKIFSQDEKQYVAKKLKSNRLLYSAELFYKLSECERLFVKIHGSENLLTADKGDFLAKVHVIAGQELDFSKGFKTVKSNLYSKYVITKIFQDILLDERNKAYQKLKETLAERTKKLIEDGECAEDILQLSHIISKANSAQNTYLLQEIIKNNYISSVLHRAADKFLKAEEILLLRNRALPKFSNYVQITVNDLYQTLKNTCEEGIMKHKEHLRNKCPKNNYRLYCQLLKISDLPSQNLFYIKSSDITLFSDLHAIYKQRYPEEEIVIQNFLDDLWNDFYNKLRDVKRYEPVKNVTVSISPVYVSLFKSFLELQAEISTLTKINVNELLKRDENKYKISDSIDFLESSPINSAIEHQYRLIFKLLKFYNPNRYSPKKKFDYEFKLKEKEGNSKWWSFFRSDQKELKSLSKERLVWLYILDCGLSHVSPDTSNEHILKLIQSLFKGFTKFLKETEHDRFESFRVVTHNIIKFAAHISPSVSNIGSESVKLDYSILDKQIDFISDMLSSDDSLVMDHFPSLIVVYNEYWKSRNSVIGKIVENCPYVEFKEEIKNSIFLNLLEVLDSALSKKVTVQKMTYFFRLYHEYLEHFKSLKFEWLVSVSCIEELAESTFPYCHVVNEKARSFKVSNSEEFIKYLKSKNIKTPKHYLIELIKKLLHAVRLSLSKENWSDGDQLKAAGDIFLAIGHSLVHFKDQANYSDFENFLNDCSLPFKTVIENCLTYNEFKSRLDSVENFYLYTRKQNEVNPETAIDLCLEQSVPANSIGFQTNINKTILLEAYEKYSNKFTSLVNTSIENIVSDLRSELIDIPTIDLWTPTFKQNTIPSLLASLAAIWTILESEDVVGIGKKIKPHCVQIICILRLLSVDSDSNAIHNHLCQVLTGQGKSIILGLLSAVLAVTGHFVDTACYSKYLTRRDALAFFKFFARLQEFEVLHRVKYSMIDDIANKLICPKINGGTETLRSLVRKLILNKFPPYITETSQNTSNTILSIDEVDVFFSENFYPKTYNACAIVDMEALLEIQPRLWEIIEEEIYDKDIVLARIYEFIYELIRDPKHEKFRAFFDSTRIFFNKHLEEMITIAINVSKAKENTDVWYINNFKINDAGIITYQDKFGLYRSDLYNSYYNMFNYFRLKKTDFNHKNYDNFGYLHVNCGQVSYASLPKEYPLILGVSGVLTTLNKSEVEAIKSYNIDTMTVMPSFFGSRKLKFKFNPVLNFVLEKTEDSWLEKIYNNVSSCVDRGRAVLVFFDTEKEIKMFKERFLNKINRLHILTGNEEPTTLEEYINEAGLAETVTLATRTMGRGVDYKSNDLSVEEKGGTHVVQTFFSLDEKEEIQIQGRTARKDNEGSYELILCQTHLGTLECSKTDEGKDVTSYKQLCAIRKTKADLKGATINENNKKSLEKHNLTLKFMKSFNNYTPNRRNDYFSCYPFEELEGGK